MSRWEVGVLPGPHADPDYVSREFMEGTFLGGAAYKVRGSTRGGHSAVFGSWRAPLVKYVGGGECTRAWVLIMVTLR